MNNLLTRSKTGSSFRRLLRITFAVALLLWTARAVSAAPEGTQPAPAPRPGLPAAEASATTAPPTIHGLLSLEGAVALALQYSPAVLQAQQEVAMAQARVGGAAAGGNPSLSATLFASRSSWGNILSTPDGAPPVNLMGIPPGSFIDQNLTAMLPIYTGGRVETAGRAARAERAATSADQESARQDVALQTRIAYRKVLYQRALMDAQQQNLTAALESLRLDEIRVTAGKLAQVSLYRDRTQAANAQREVTNAIRDWREAMFALEMTMGISLQSRLNLTGELQTPAVSPAEVPLSMTEAPSPEETAELQALENAAAVHRSEIAAAVERTAGAAAQVTRARASYRPQVNIMGMGDLTRGGSGVRNGLNYTLGIAAGLPIFEGGALSAAEREAEASLAKTKAAETAVRLQVNSDVANAWLNGKAARQNVQTAQTGLAQAQEDYTIQQLRYTSGKGIQLEVLDALAALTTARVQVDRAYFESAVAEDQLLRALGTLLPKTDLTPSLTP